MVEWVFGRDRQGRVSAYFLLILAPHGVLALERRCTNGGALGLDFDRRLKLQFRGSAITSDAGLLAYRELDDVLALTTIGGERLADARTGKNRQHLLVGLLRQAGFGRLAGYEDGNDAERLCRDPAMRWVVGGRA